MERTFEIGTRLNHMKLKALAAYRFSEFEFKRYHFDRALEWLDISEGWSRQLGWSRGLAWILYRRGITFIRQGNQSYAEKSLMQSLKIATSWNERHLIAYNKYRLAQVYESVNRLPLARQMAEEAHDLYERLRMTHRLRQAEELLQRLSEKGINR